MLIKGMEIACLAVERDAKKMCPHRDGILVGSITHEVVNDNGNVAGYVGSNLEYAPYVHQGTGIYAIEGNGRKEVPWHYKDSKGEWHSTKGMKPTPFLTDALNKNRKSILTAFRGTFGK